MLGKTLGNASGECENTVDDIYICNLRMNMMLKM